MTDEQMRVAIAEACGWTSIHVDTETLKGFPVLCGKHPKLGIDQAVPDYTNDLNAMHSAVMSRSMDWRMVFQNALQRTAVAQRKIIVELTAQDWATCFLTVEREWLKINA